MTILSERPNPDNWTGLEGSEKGTQLEGFLHSHTDSTAEAHSEHQTCREGASPKHVETNSVGRERLNNF